MFSSDVLRSCAEFTAFQGFSPPIGTKFSRQFVDGSGHLMNATYTGADNSFIFLKRPRALGEWFIISSKTQYYFKRDDDCKVKFAYDMHGNQYVLKILIVDNQDLESEDVEETLDKFKNERDILYRLGNLVAYGSRQTGIQTKHYLIQHYISGRALSTFFREGTERIWLDLKLQQQMFIQIIQALVKLQKTGIIHQDLHANNILIDETTLPHSGFSVNLIDYGESVFEDNGLVGGALLGGRMVDYRSLGVILKQHFDAQRLYDANLLPRNFDVILRRLHDDSHFTQVIQLLMPLGITFE